MIVKMKPSTCNYMYNTDLSHISGGTFEAVEAGTGCYIELSDMDVSFEEAVKNRDMDAEDRPFALYFHRGEFEVVIK